MKVNRVNALLKVRRTLNNFGTTVPNFRKAGADRALKALCFQVPPDLSSLPCALGVSGPQVVSALCCDFAAHAQPDVVALSFKLKAAPLISGENPILFVCCCELRRRCDGRQESIQRASVSSVLSALG